MAPRALWLSMIPLGDTLDNTRGDTQIMDLDIMEQLNSWRVEMQMAKEKADAEAAEARARERLRSGYDEIL